MRELVRWPGGWRSAVGVAVVLVLAVGASLVYGDRGREQRVRGASPQEMAALLDADAGRLVVDASGRPVEGPDGKPLRVGRDGRTLLDDGGRPLRDRRGRPMRVSPGGRLPRALTGPGRSGRRPARRGGERGGAPRRPGRGRGRGRPVRAPRPDAQELLIGLVFIDPESLRKAYAVYGADPGAVDPTAAANAVAARINATGGIGGHRIGVRSHAVKLDGDYDAAFLAACQRFKGMEPRPLAVIQHGTRIDQVGECLHDAGIPLIADPAVGPGHRWLTDGARGTLTVLPAAPAIDRVQEAFVAELVDAEFFGPDAKLGLIWQARPDHQAGAEAFQAALRRRRLEPTDAEQLQMTRGLPDVAVVASRIASTLVRFRSRGVNRLVVIDHAGELTGSVGLIARAQEYRPRWGVTSAGGPHQLAHHVPGQLRGAVGIGWHPTIDVLEQHEGARSTTYHECQRVLAGTAPGGRTIFGQALTYTVCDGMLLLQAAAGRDLAGGAVVAAIERLGSSFTSALGFSTRFGPGRRDGMDGHRRLRFDADGCTCFVYG